MSTASINFCIEYGTKSKQGRMAAASDRLLFDMIGCQYFIDKVMTPMMVKRFIVNPSKMAFAKHFIEGMQIFMSYVSSMGQTLTKEKVLTEVNLSSLLQPNLTEPRTMGEYNK